MLYLPLSTTLHCIWNITKHIKDYLLTYKIVGRIRDKEISLLIKTIEMNKIIFLHFCQWYVQELIDDLPVIYCLPAILASWINTLLKMQVWIQWYDLSSQLHVQDYGEIYISLFRENKDDKVNNILTLSVFNSKKYTFFEVISFVYFYVKSPSLVKFAIVNAIFKWHYLKE
jgi:hypothetical protein